MVSVLSTTSLALRTVDKIVVALNESYVADMVSVDNWSRVRHAVEAD